MQTKHLIIFTDLDGTLLNQTDYNYEPALPVLKRLQENNIPIIPVTSKTRQEVEYLRTELALTDPFIVENGSAIFIAWDDKKFAVQDCQKQNNYYIKKFGITYSEARQKLLALARELGEKLRGFGDLTAREIEQFTGLSPEEVKRAKAREFTEPFITPSNVQIETLEKAAHKLGLQIVVGDRFCHLIGAESGKGKAVEWLKQHYQLAQSQDKVITIGLGNSPNDLAMLEVVDFPIIIPGIKGPHPGLIGRGWEVAPSPGSQGWAEAVAALWGN